MRVGAPGWAPSAAFTEPPWMTVCEDSCHVASTWPWAPDGDLRAPPNFHPRGGLTAPVSHREPPRPGRFRGAGKLRVGLLVGPPWLTPAALSSERVLFGGNHQPFGQSLGAPGRRCPEPSSPRRRRATRSAASDLPPRAGSSAPGPEVLARVGQGRVCSTIPCIAVSCPRFCPLWAWFLGFL